MTCTARCLGLPFSTIIYSLKKALYACILDFSMDIKVVWLDIILSYHTVCLHVLVCSVRVGFCPIIILVCSFVVYGFDGVLTADDQLSRLTVRSDHTCQATKVLSSGAERS